MYILDKESIRAQRDPHGVLHQIDVRWAEKLPASLQWRGVVPSDDNIAKKLAWKLMGSTVVIYSGPILRQGAQQWKRSINRHAQSLAWVGCSEDADDMMGWYSHPIEKPYRVVELHSSYDELNVKHAYEVADRYLSGKRPMPTVVDAVGETSDDQVMWATALGDYVSVYMAVLHGVDPASDELRQRFASQ